MSRGLQLAYYRGLCSMAAAGIYFREEVIPQTAQTAPAAIFRRSATVVGKQRPWTTL
jgi:hypothetical protein